MALNVMLPAKESVGRASAPYPTRVTLFIPSEEAVYQLPGGEAAICEATLAGREFGAILTDPVAPPPQVRVKGPPVVEPDKTVKVAMV